MDDNDLCTMFSVKWNPHTAYINNLHYIGHFVVAWLNSKSVIRNDAQSDIQRAQRIFCVLHIQLNGRI